MTGVDKDDRHYWWTRLTITTYGMMWRWVTSSEQNSVEVLLNRHSAFMLDEFSGRVDEKTQILQTDPQSSEVARTIAQVVRRRPEPPPTV